jgi:hypothetical protein
MHRFAPLLYTIYWLLHVSAVVRHHQGAYACEILFALKQGDYYFYYI